METLKYPNATLRVPRDGYRTDDQKREAEKTLSEMPYIVRPRRTIIADVATHTEDFGEYAELPHFTKRVRARTKKRWLTIGLLGAGAIIVLAITGMNLYIAIMNTVVTPIAERDRVPFLDVSTGYGHHVRVSAFVDENNRLDILIVRDGNVAHAQIIVKDQILTMRNPQHARVQMQVDTRHSTVKTITILITLSGPLSIRWFWVVPESTSYPFQIQKEA